jgi:conjugative relaxase-like TrwC/TraI family protein
MLRARTIGSAAQAKNYYLSGLSRADYYTSEQGQEVVGQWHGRGAFLLGLHGDVTQEHFFALADNQHPTRGGTLTVRQRLDRRVGMDFTFNAPKSVSLLYSLTGDERILAAFRAAVTGTMHEMESAVQTQVCKGGSQAPRTTGNMVWCDFMHTLARPVDGIPDPSLHAHCVAFNATFDLKEQRWKAGEFHDLKRDAAYYEAAFHARLAVAMGELGYGIER